MTSSGDQARLIPNVIDNIATSEPDAVWMEFPKSTTSYEDGFQAITYAEFANAINGMAHHLEKTLGKPAAKNTPLAYLAPNDGRCAITLIAAVKVGYTLFLTSDRNSVSAQMSLLDDLACTTLVTTSPPVTAAQAILYERNLKTVFIPTLNELLSSTYPNYPYEMTFDECRSELAFICHSSGSTGFPQPRLVTHEYIVRAARNIHLVAPEGFEMLSTMTGNNRNMLLLPLAHPAGIHFGIFNPLFNRCTIIIPLPTIPPTGETLVEMLKHNTADWATTAPLTLETLSKNTHLLDIITSRLKMLLYSGGGLPKIFGDILASRIKLATLLGSTESGPLPAMYPTNFDFEHDWNYIQLHPAVGAKFEHLRADTYELIIVRSPECEPHQTVFTLFTGLTEYRTKDIFTPHPCLPDVWTHASRSDDVVVFLNSLKFNPIAFESQVTTHINVVSTLMFGNQRFEAGLLIELAKTPSSTSERAELINKLWPTIENANSLAPGYARVSKSHILFTLPDKPVLRTAKGTLRRRATLDSYSDEIDRLYADIEVAWTLNTGTQDWSEVNARAAIQAFFTDTLKLGDLDDDADFFGHGLDSLGVLRLVRHLKMFTSISSVDPSMIYSHPSMDSLVQGLKDLYLQRKSSDEERKLQREKEITETSQRFIGAIDDMAANATDSEEGFYRETAEHHVLLTGSTGSTGSYILAALLSCPKVAHIYCLNRGPDTEVLQKERNSKLDPSLPTTFSNQKTTFLTADLSDPNTFGLEPSIYSNLVENTTLIIHNAWLVDFNLPLESFQPNLNGLLNLISFTKTCFSSPLFIYLSSISSVMSHTTPIPEAIITSPSAPSSGYGSSKYIAEQMLAHASRVLNLQIVVLRIGQIAGAAHSTGLWKMSEWIPSLILSSKYLGFLPDSLGENDVVDWLPVDILSDIIVEISTSSNALGASDTGTCNVYNILNPNLTTWKKLLPFIITAMESTSRQTIPVVAPETWLRQLRSTVKHLDPADVERINGNPALNLIDFFEAIFNGDENRPTWEIEKLKRDSKSFRDAKPIDGDLMGRWVKAWLS